MKISITPTYDRNDLLPLGIIRMHVRALDDSEDPLLGYYLDAAIDYLAQQTNRVLGSATATVVLDKDAASEVVSLHGLNDVTSVTVEYLKEDNTYETLDASEYVVHMAYPAKVDLTDATPDGISEKGDDVFRITVNCGMPLDCLPRQYHQAALLLVGHYYNQREAEVIGQITSELKEGVRRLIGSARQY